MLEERKIPCTENSTYYHRITGIWDGQQEIPHLDGFCLGPDYHQPLASQFQIFSCSPVRLLSFLQERSVVEQGHNRLCIVTIYPQNN